MSKPQPCCECFPHTHKSIFHARVFQRQGLDAFAYIPQPVNFQQKVLESQAIAGPSADEVSRPQGLTDSVLTST